VIPDSVTSIGIDAFCGCTDLISIKVGKNNRVYNSHDNCNAIIITSTNTLIARCKNTVIPYGVRYIGCNAFAGCKGLSSVTIPNSVKSIKWRAFYGCTGLTFITIPNSVTEIDFKAFEGCKNLIIHAPVNSFAIKYAEKNRIKYQKP